MRTPGAASSTSSSGTAEARGAGFSYASSTRSAQLFASSTAFGPDELPLLLDFVDRLAAPASLPSGAGRAATHGLPPAGLGPAVGRHLPAAGTLA